LYLQNHLHVLTRFYGNYCIILSVILTHQPFIISCVLYAHISIFFTVFPPVALLICIYVPFISFFVIHSCKTAIFTYWFWRNSSESNKIFLAQKKIVRIMTGSRPKTSCKLLFQSLGILTITSHYILSLMKFLLQNQEKFTFNTEVHNIKARNKLKLHKPVSNLTLYQKGVYCMSIRIFYRLPDCIARVVENKRSFNSI